MIVFKTLQLSRFVVMTLMVIVVIVVMWESSGCFYRSS